MENLYCVNIKTINDTNEHKFSRLSTLMHYTSTTIISKVRQLIGDEFCFFHLLRVSQVNVNLTYMTNLQFTCLTQLIPMMSAQIIAMDRLSICSDSL